MKKFRNYYIAAAIGLIATGCASDDFSRNDNFGVDPEDGVFIAVDIAMPSAQKGTRSQTDVSGGSTSGVEIGQDYENKVREVMIVLATPGNSFIANASVTSDKLLPLASEKGVYKSTSKFSKTEMAQYYSSQLFSQDVNVFVFCNPTTQLKRILDAASLGDTDWYNQMGDYQLGNNDDVIWSKENFLMSNSEIAVRKLPASMDDWNNYSVEANPFNLSGINSLGRPNEIDNQSNNKGNVKVERTSARFDFRDGSVDGVNNEDLNGIGNCTYEVVFDNTSGSQKSQSLINVKLGKMALVNMNNKFYFLKRVSPNGTNVDWKICGKEIPWQTGEDGTPVGTPGNYVVDAYWQWKQENPTSGFNSHFNYPFFNEDGTIDNTNVSNDRWNTSLISDVLTGTDYINDNSQNWNADGKYPTYKIWKYSTESCIPGIEHQKNGVSTGIVFKGKLIATDYAASSSDNWKKLLAQAINKESTVENDPNRSSLTDPILYLFAGHLYYTWENIRRAAISAAVTDLRWDNATSTFTYNVNRSNSLYHAVFGDGGFGEIQINYNTTDANGGIMDSGTYTLKDNLAQDAASANSKWDAWSKAGKTIGAEYTAMKEAVTNAQITIYQSSYDKDLGGWGYYCYYYYWNRHNDNGKNGIMGPMEFDVVRNNVYKLAVTKIARLGHPRISANDPDKPAPDTDDEQSNVYITVQCEILPWVVRVNNIEFL